jgi:hypothetical protein
VKLPATVGVLSFLLALLWGTVAAAQNESIVTEGVAAVIGGNTAAARDKAIDDALRKAVEQAVGTLVSSETFTERYRTINDQVNSRTAGYVRRYKILSETAEETLLRVKIRAEVARANLMNDLSALGLLLEQAQKPKVMVIFAEQVGGLYWTTAWERLGQAESTLMEELLAAGFNVVDADQTRHNITRDMALRLFEGNASAAELEGLKYQAQVVITGKAFSKFAVKHLQGTQLQSIQATLQARAVRTDTGRVISSRSATAAKAHLDELQGGALAIAQATAKLADEMIADIIRHWRGEVYGRSREITLMISGLASYRHLTAVRRVLEKEVQGVRAVHQRSYTGGIAELMLDYGGSAANIADALAAHEFHGFRLNPTNVTPNRVDAKVVLNP